MLRCNLRCFVIAATVLCWLFLPSAYYGSLLRFSEGANNLPLLPAAHLVFYILTLFLIVPPLLASRFTGMGKKGHLPAAALCGGLGILCVVMAPERFGPMRSASRFILWNGSLDGTDDPVSQYFAAARLSPTRLATPVCSFSSCNSSIYAFSLRCPLQDRCFRRRGLQNVDKSICGQPVARAIRMRHSRCRLWTNIPGWDFRSPALVIRPWRDM